MNEKNYQLIAFTEDGLSLDVRVDAEKETVWLTQAEMAELFDVNVDTIGLHLRNIYREGELEASTYEESSVVRFEGKRQVKRTIRIYDLDAIIAVGYRVKSRRGLIFRRWANKVLKQYLIEGYALNEKRLSALNRTVEAQRARSDGDRLRRLSGFDDPHCRKQAGREGDHGRRHHEYDWQINT